MTSARLRDLLQRELPRIHARGGGELVRAFLDLDHGGEFARLEAYVEGCKRVATEAALRDEGWLESVLRYFIGRTLAFPLDRAGAALPELVLLLAELQDGPHRGSTLSALVELELLRACHKIDAPGHRDTLVAGSRALWPRLQGDLGPSTELLDVVWRTGWWCREPALMGDARRLAATQSQSLRFSAGYWHARERSLEGEAEEAVALLEGLLDDEGALAAAGTSWTHYLEVELARNEVAVGRTAAARSRLDRIAAELPPVQDPMLCWDHALACVDLARANADVGGEISAWSRALDVVAGLGTDRLEAEFALGLATAALRGEGAAQSFAFARARERLAALLPTLRSGESLAAQARALPGLYS
ncbi:MAG: hypothetical protein EXS13_01010 [Planctomycetes bacterium]|nr:hypothetical protein [Planctomycetota bacterium]